MNVYPFIEAERQRSHDEAGGGNVARACELLKVSRSAYYAHAAVEAAGGTARAREDAELTARIVAAECRRACSECPVRVLIRTRARS